MLWQSHSHQLVQNATKLTKPRRRAIVGCKNDDIEHAPLVDAGGGATGETTGAKVVGGKVGVQVAGCVLMVGVGIVVVLPGIGVMVGPDGLSQQTGAKS